MSYRSALIAPWILISAGVASAASIDDGTGSKGFKFLQVAVDARSAALARASVASGGSQTMLTVNPAGLADVSAFHLAGAHTEWLSTIRHEYLGIAWPQFDGVVAVALRAQTSGDIPLRAIDDGTSFVGVPSPEPQGTYGVHDAAFTVAYARRIGRFDWGVGASYVYEKIYFSSVSAAALDIGVRWHAGRVTVGAALRNIGVSERLRAERVPLPWDAQAGVMYERPVAGMTIRTMADVRYAPDFYETLHLGAEAQLTSVFVLRAGYQTNGVKNPDDTGLSAGTGLRYGAFRLDYAYIPERDGLGSGHLFNLSIGR